MLKYQFLIIILILPLISISQIYDETDPIHADEYGGNLSMAMSGFGFGGFYRFALPNFFYVGANLEFYMMRDDKEVQFYDPYTHRYYEANNVNRLFLIPMGIELKKRLFSNGIDEGFRPYLASTAGLTFGMNFPKDENTQINDNEYQFTFNFALGIGVDFRTSNGHYVSVRPLYRFVYFPDDIAFKKNHSNFEIRFEFGIRKLDDIYR